MKKITVPFDYDQYEREFVCDPAIISSVTKQKMTDKNCPCNDEGKRVFQNIKKPFSSPRRWKNAVEECRRQSMIYSNDVYLSLNNRWCQRNTNSIVFGASGTGKTRCFLKPNILQDNGSFICADSFGDIMRKTGDFLEKKGYTIKCLNLSDMTQSCRFNPLYYIRDTKDIAVVAQAFLASMKIGNTNDEFWNKSLQALMCCVIGYLYEVCPIEQRNFSNVLEIVRMDKHKVDEQPGTQSDFDLLFKALGQANPASYAYLQYQNYTQARGETRIKILISLSVSLQQLDIPEVRNLTYKDELELDKLGSEKIALFLRFPLIDSSFNWLFEMLFSVLFIRLYAYGEQRMNLSVDGVDIDEYFAWLKQNKKKDCNNSLTEFRNTEHTEVQRLRYPEMKIPVRIFLDDCANLGKIPGLEEHLLSCGRYRISIIPIFQNYSQVVQIYGKEQAKRIIFNCDVLLIFGYNNIGDTIEIIKAHPSRSLANFSSIETLNNSECVVFIRELPPFRSRKYDLCIHPNYKYSAEADGAAYTTPFRLSDDDELIESLRIKSPTNYSAIE